jgi:hypothetical protein
MQDVFIEQVFNMLTAQNVFIEQGQFENLPNSHHIRSSA